MTVKLVVLFVLSLLVLNFHTIDAQITRLLRRILQSNGDDGFTVSCKFAGRYPFIASIKDGTEEKGHLCGGILVKKNVILTAAHCVDPRSTPNASYTPQVSLGGYDLSNPVEVLRSVRAFPHPEWTGHIQDGNDLAILKLERKSCLRPIKGIGNSTELSNESNTYNFYFYGKDGPGINATVNLRFLSMDYINPSACNNVHGVAPEDTQVCFAEGNQIGVCKGDDGGPLTKTPPPSVLAFDPEVIGLASYTTGPCEGPGAAVFVNLSAYKDWIKATLKSKVFKKA